MRNVVLLALVSVGLASAQSISVGVLGGVPLTDAVSGINTGTAYVVGPSFQVGLPLSLRFEADALYRPLNFGVPFAASTLSPIPGLVPTASASQWQFPFLLQYRFKTPIVKPFVEAGVAFEHIANVSSAASNLSLHDNDAALVLGAGADLKIPFIRLSGEIRYTHSGANNFGSLSNVNQAEVLFGIHF